MYVYTLNLKKWQPVTIEELQAMTDADKMQILSCDWKYDEFREGTIGIKDVKVTQITYDNPCYLVEWVTSDGYPSNLMVNSKTDKLHRLAGTQARWRNGLYKKI